MLLLIPSLCPGDAMASTTMDAIGGGAVDDSNVACSSLWPLAVGNNMAVDSMAPDNFANHHSPEGYNHSGHAHDSFTSGNNVSVDDAGGADAHAHDTPAHQAPEDYVHVGYFVNGHIVDQDTPDIYIGPGDASDKSQSESFMSFDGAGGYHTAAPDNSQRHAITIIGKLSPFLPSPHSCRMPTLTLVQTTSRRINAPSFRPLWARPRSRPLPLRCTSSCSSLWKSV